MISMFE